MTIFKDVFSELVSMFLGDARMSGATLAVVAVAAGLIDLAHVEPLISGGVLLIGSLVVVLVAVRFAARSHGAGKGDATPGQLETPGANRHAGETSRDGLLGSAQTWLGRSRQRRDLKELDDRLLDDIGVSRGAAEAECRRLD
ncbi:MAG TPA: DUF1127 domain-containing protein [Kiloniellaceae bacterium]